MNILIISYSYPPSNAPAAQRPYYMAKHLSELGWDVTVFTDLNSISSLGYSEIIPLKNVKVISTSGTFKGSAVSKVHSNYKKASSKWKFVTWVKRLLMIPDRGVVWFPSAIKEIKKMDLSNFDVVYSTSPSFINHILAKRVKKINPEINWAADFRDFHYIHAREKSNSIRKFLDKKHERTILSKANVLTFISSQMLQLYTEDYPSIVSKSHVVINGFDPELGTNAIESCKSDKLVITYAGSFYGGIRSPFPLFELLEELLNQNKISLNKIEINIAGLVPANIEAKLKQFNAYRATIFHGIVSKKEVYKLYQRSYLLWLIVGNEVSHYSGFPIKVFEYIGFNKRILAYTPVKSEIEQLIKELDCGLCFGYEVNDIQRNEFMHHYNLFINGESSASISIDKLKLENYTKKKQAIRLTEILR